MSSRPASRPICPWILALVLSGCREGSSRAGDFIPVVPPPAGTQGCAPLAAAPGTATNVFTHAAFGPMSQIAAVAGQETLYWTGDDGSIHELVFPLGGGAPIDTLLVSPGTIEADYLAPAGILDPAELSGIAILDDEFLVVAEHASNTLLFVSRDSPDTVGNLAGRRDAAGGFASGSGGNLRFHFSAPAPLLVDAAGFVYVGDTENHALRQVEIGGLPVGITVAGSGAPGSGSGSLSQTGFDTPSGLAASCLGEILVVESGAAGAGGHRLLSLRLGGFSPFGGLVGSALVLAGDGTNATLAGVGTAAQLAAPVGLVSTSDDQLLWIDSTGGILRRMDLVSGLCDCPMFVDCATAVASPSAFGGARFSLALADSGALYVLAGDTETLFRVDP
jgi:hypothetical protein